MQKAISTYAFRDSLLGVHLLDQIARAGFQQVEIYCARRHFDYTDPNHRREIADWFSGQPVELLSLHAPLSRDPQETTHHAVVSIAFVEKRRRQESVDEIKRALELAELLPFRYLVLHLGVPGEEFDLRKFDAALTCLEHLRLFARQRGVQLLLENILNDLSTPQRLAEFFHHAHWHDLKICFDTGHALLEGSVEKGLHLLRGSIAATHLHDNSGAKDDHLLPFEGKLPWEQTLRLLRAVAPAAPLLLEVRQDGPVETTLQKAVAVFDKFERLLAKEES